MPNRNRVSSGRALLIGIAGIVIGVALVALGLGGMIQQLEGTQAAGETAGVATTTATTPGRASVPTRTAEPHPLDIKMPSTATPVPTSPPAPEPTATAAVEAPPTPPETPQPVPESAPDTVQPAYSVPESNVSTVTRVQVPSAGIDTPVVQVGYQMIEIQGQTVIQWNVAEWAAGHHSISANPGEGGNVVIAGHVAGGGEVFRTLELAEIGDEVLVSTTEGEFRYVITEVHLRLDAGAPLEERLAIGAFMQPMPEERVTLITCWPYGVYDHRLLVVAKPIAP